MAITGSTNVGQFRHLVTSRSPRNSRKPKRKPSALDTVMFPHRVFGCLEGLFAEADVAICGTLFTDRFTPQKNCDLASRLVPLISFICEGAIQATSMDRTPERGRRKSRSDIVHLRSLPQTQPVTRIELVAWGASEQLGGGNETQSGLGGSEKRWPGYLLRAIRHGRFPTSAPTQRSIAAPQPQPRIDNIELASHMLCSAASLTSLRHSGATLGLDF